MAWWWHYSHSNITQELFGHWWLYVWLRSIWNSIDDPSLIDPKKGNKVTVEICRPGAAGQQWIYKPDTKVFVVAGYGNMTLVQNIVWSTHQSTRSLSQLA
jgi:hypothetical protein